MIDNEYFLKKNSGAMVERYSSYGSIEENSQ